MVVSWAAPPVKQRGSDEPAEREVITEELVSIADVCEQLGKLKTHIFKVVDRLRIEKTMIPDAARGNQKVAHIRASDVARVR